MSLVKFKCNGIGRRDFLQVGLGGMLGAGFSDLLRARETVSGGKKINCILVWLDGGPTHYETFDPKPNSPKEIRGEFGSMKTNVPGTHFCDKVPHLAKVADKVTIVRSIWHKDPNHGGGNHYMMTGAPPRIPVGCGAFVSFHPSMGSVTASEVGAPDGLPSYFSMPRMSRSGGPNFLGARYAPFVVADDPSNENFRVRDVALPNGLTGERFGARRDLRQSVDQLLRIADKKAGDPVNSIDQFYQQGYQLVTSPAAQQAFDIHQEPDKIRDRYGRNRTDRPGRHARSLRRGL